MINEEIIKNLAEEACASIRFRFRREILEKNSDINDYLDEILDDNRVKYAFSWQKSDGYLGQSFHAGWIPDAKLKHLNTGAEGALRFLSEMAVPENNPVVKKGLLALLKDNWCTDKGKWVNEYQPEIGLFGKDLMRATVFSYFGVEEHDFIKIEIQRALEVINKATEIPSIGEITGIYQNKMYFNKGIPLPEIYHLKLLSFTKGWRNSINTSRIAKAIEHLIELSPLPETFIKCDGQLIAPARIAPRDLKKSPMDLQPKEWFWWMHTMELFARMGIVRQVPLLTQQVNDLREIINKGNGFCSIKPDSRSFTNWSVYSGLALEESWKNDRWKYDLTFRSYLILKFSNML